MPESNPTILGGIIAIGRDLPQVISERRLVCSDVKGSLLRCIA